MLVQFKLNKEFDKKVINDFINLKCGGVDFGEGIISLHPKLKRITKLGYNERKAIISRYVNDYYKNNQSMLNRSLKGIREKWYKVEKDYFEEVKKVFNIKRKLSRSYVAFISIVNCNPRWISKKEFCIYVHSPVNEKLQIICHELLHFFFYDYIQKFPKALSLEKKWVFSEVFNTVILNLLEFKRFFRPLKEESYPEHRKYVKKLGEIYKGSKSVKEFFKKGIRMFIS